MMGLARTVRFLVRDTWPPIAILRTKWFVTFPPAGLVLDTPEEHAKVKEDENGNFTFRGRPVAKLQNGYWQVTQGHWAGELVDCHHCLGGWAAIPAAFWCYFAGGTAVASTFAAFSISPFVAVLTIWAAMWFFVSAFAGRI